MKRLTTVLLLIAMAGLCSGCTSRNWRTTQPVLQIHYSVFEVDAKDAGATGWAEDRQPLAGTPYDLAVVPVAAVAALERLTRVDTGPLAAGDEAVVGWPHGDVCTWTYSHADGTLLGGGSGGGTLGVRWLEGSPEFRLEFNVNHRIQPVGSPDRPASRDATTSIESRISFQGTVENGQAVLFRAPFLRLDGEEVTHVIAFGVGGWH